MKQKIIFLSFLLLFLIKAGKAEFDCFFEHFSTESGLSHGSVSTMLKDKQGFMWFATWDGINRFDGYTFKTYKPSEADNPNSSSNRVESMMEDFWGNIWIMTYDSKVFRLNRLTEKFDPIGVEALRNDQIDITSMVSTSTGDVWLSTSSSGALRVFSDADNHQFEIEHYSFGGTLPLPGNSIRFIKEDSKKNIWINTDGGMVCLVKEKATRKLIRKEIDFETRTIFEKSSVSSFYSSTDNVYFGTNTGKILIYYQASGNIKEVDFQNESSIKVIVGNEKGTVYLGTSGNGIFEYNESLSKITNHYFHSTVEKVLKIFVDSQNLIWVETTLPGYSMIDPASKSFRHFEQALDVNQELRSTAQCGIMEDKNHTVWLTLKGGGFGYYNRLTGSFEYFYNKPGDPQSKISNYVYNFYKDSTDVLWLSTYFKGIEKVTFLQKKFNFIQPSPQSNFSIANEVRAIMEDSKGLLWVATKKQELFLLDRNFQLVKKIDQLNGQKTGMVYAMDEDSKGNIYLGTKGNGLFVLSRNGLYDFEVKHFKHDSNNSTTISSNNIYSILEDSKKRIWIGTYDGGLNRFENGRFIHSVNSLENYPKDVGKKIRQVVEDTKGNIWLATTDGIVLLDGTTSDSPDPTFRFFSSEKGNAKGLKGTDVYWIYCDKNSAIWVATLGGGLAKLKNSPDRGQSLEFNVLTKKDGLPSDVIFTIVGDRIGNLWMSTENGIAYYNPKQQVFRNYNNYDGIVNSGFSEAACTFRSDGNICFGANNGFYYFNPSSFKKDQKRVALVFTGFQLFNKEVEPGKGSLLEKAITETKSIRLKYNQNAISITWAGLDFSIQDKIRYLYQLTGYDPDWHLVKDQGKASYTKLPPGKYTFTVKFDNPELQKLNSPKSLEIEVLPPVWKTIWAYMFYLLLSIVLIEVARRIATTMIRLRNKVIIEKELTDIKLNFFTNISHELRTPLTLILGPVNEIKTKETLSENGKNYALLIEQNAQRLLRLVNRLLDFRKVQNGKMELVLNEVDIVEFTKEVCRNFDELATEKKIIFSVHSTKSSINCRIDEEKMDSVIFNLLSNAFKFTPENGAITISIEHPSAANFVTIEIKDSGIGVPKEHESSLFKRFASHYDSHQTKLAGTGIGLSLSKELVLLHGGELSYLPTPGGGATFIIKLKVENNHDAAPELNKKSKSLIEETISNKAESKTQINKENAGQYALPLILVVEDNHDLCNFLRLQLEEDFLVETAENGRVGLDKALKLQPDIILSDVLMPEMDGIQLLDKIKNNFETSHIPVVLLTAKSSIESKVEGLKYGADAYMTKPFNSDQLKAQLKNLLHQRVILREHYANHKDEAEKHFQLTVTDKDAEFLNKVRLIIEEDLANVDFKIEDIYKNIGMGRSKFFDKLKGLTGQSPIDFVREYRLNKAITLLQSGNYNVTEASYLSGFSDAGYFSKCFKERFGISPSHYGKKA
jgi:signal transduction histidine kinase/ligand-binding sensor domain-containing protein/CheY-like chemotaxis protein/AraC-like DNA-binding protein